jgi:hypothetical protein
VRARKRGSLPHRSRDTLHRCPPGLIPLVSVALNGSDDSRKYAIF